MRCRRRALVLHNRAPAQLESACLLLAIPSSRMPDMGWTKRERVREREREYIGWNGGYWLGFIGGMEGFRTVCPSFKIE